MSYNKNTPQEIDIPSQLKKRGNKFIKLRTGSKLPMEKGWNAENNYEFDDPKIQSFMKENSIYGVCTGINGLIVIDCDIKLTETIVERELPKTFKVKTPGGSHFYYKSEPDKTKLLKHNILKDSTGAPVHMGEIRGVGSQVVGPWSFSFKKQKYYIVENDIEIVEVSKEKIEEVFKKFLVKPKEKKEWHGIEHPALVKIKEYFPLQEIMADYGYNMNKNPTKCLWHKSKGNGSFGYNNTVYNCFHCLKKGNVVHLVAEHEGLNYEEAKKMLFDKIEERDKKQS